MRKRVVVTGVGVVAPNGTGKDDFWEANLQGKSGVGPLTLFDTSKMMTKNAAQVRGFDPEQFMPRELAAKVDRFVQLGLASGKLAIEDSRLAFDRLDRDRIGVIIGSGLGGILFHEEQMVASFQKENHRMPPSSVPRTTPNAVASHLAIQYQLFGPNYVVATACASGNHAVGEAFKKIQDDKADVMLAGGTEAPLTPYTFGAFYSLRTLSKADRPPHQASRPFDNQRDGFVMAEGSAVLILEELEHARNRDAYIYAEIAGYGLSSGAYHMVIPRPDGEDAARTIHLALDDAGMTPDEIDYINAHGTSTKANDIAETKAIKAVFKSRAKKIPVSSTKSMIGHSIGAAGAIEAVAACLTIDNQVIPPTINYEHPDPECDLDYVPNHPRKGQIGTVLSNSFGFGNVNACIIFKNIRS